MVPLGERAKPMGEWKLTAVAPMPSVDAAVPEPASVETAPLATATERSMWLELSATSSVAPSELRANPMG
jgi:hypothetical protein